MMVTRIVIVDESATIHKIFQITLAVYEVEVHRATSLMDVHRQFQRNPFDLVMVDGSAVTESKEGARQFADSLKGIPFSRVVVLIGKSSPNREEHLRDQGFTHFLRKPFQSHDVVRIAVEALGRQLNPHPVKYADEPSRTADRVNASSVPLPARRGVIPPVPSLEMMNPRETNYNMGQSYSSSIRDASQLEKTIEVQYLAPPPPPPPHSSLRQSRQTGNVGEVHPVAGRTMAAQPWPPEQQPNRDEYTLRKAELSSLEITRQELKELIRSEIDAIRPTLERQVRADVSEIVDRQLKAYIDSNLRETLMASISLELRKLSEEKLARY